jgi:hypothetical protein
MSPHIFIYTHLSTSTINQFSYAILIKLLRRISYNLRLSTPVYSNNPTSNDSGLFADFLRRVATP